MVVSVMGESIVYKKAFQFAIKVIELYKYLCDEKKEYILSKQLLRCGTSIGANIREGLDGQSKRDFLAKTNIALKESSEAEYWIELLIETGYLEKKSGLTYLKDIREIRKILNSIIITTKENLKHKSINSPLSTLHSPLNKGM